MTRWALGLAALGRPAYINTGSDKGLPSDRSVAALRDNTFQVLDAAVAAGIDWVDTARSYGRAEEFLGQWLNARYRAPRPGTASAPTTSAPPLVSSKWGYEYVGDWQRDAAVHERKEHSSSRLADQWRQSTQLLGSALTLYQVHSLTVSSPLFQDKRLREDLAAIAAGGLRVGFSTTGAQQAETIQRGLDLHVDGRPLFTAVQSTWNVWETSATTALARAADGGTQVIVKEALANGRLVTEPPPALTRMAAARGVGVDAVALAAAASHRWADRVLLGSVSSEQLRVNLRADAVALSAAELAELAQLSQPAEQYWAERAALPWR